MLSDASILKHLARQPKQTAGFKQLVRELGLHGNERRELDERLRQLESRGEIVRLEHDRYSLPQAAAGKNAVAGRLSMHRDGFGFVIPDPATLPAALKSHLTGDIFIPPHLVGNAMHGDRVLVDITTVRPDGRAEGRIVRPVKRAHMTLVGIFHYGARRNTVVPMDTKIAREIVIPPGMEHPESSAPGAQNEVEDADENAKPRRPRKPQKKPPSVDRVLGDEAARRANAENLEGLAVEVEITQWPAANQEAHGRVIDILGRPDDFGVDVEMTIRKFHLPHRFPPEVLEEAAAENGIISSQELARRKDFRDLPIVTIDGETARDFDDAVMVTRLANGNYELHVHIADVAHYVKPTSALDREARLRATSVYFPDRAVPMLPLELSTDLCSLRPHVDRLVLSCVMEIDPRGELVDYDLSEGVIRSAERMTYTAVNAALEGDPATVERYAPLVAGFKRMAELAQILNQKRRKRGSIDFDLPEPVIEFDELGMMKSITRSERNQANRLIEEFMLAANECVAAHLERRRVASLYRVHEKPDAKRVYDFEVLAATFGYSLGVGALPIHRVQMKADRRAARGTGKNVRHIEVPQEVHITPRMYQKLTDKISGKPEERILSYLMLRSLKQARYSEESLGHFALAAASYTHFTSPIRRYPDLIVHRILKQVLAEKTGEPGKYSEGAPSSSVRSLDGQGGDFDVQSPSPWSKRRDREFHHESLKPLGGPISLTELHEIAEESSQAERRADEAERDLMEWKKVRFMQERLGEEFDGLITSVAKYGLFVELTDLFVEGLVPIATLVSDRFVFHEPTRQLIGQRSRKAYSIGDRVRVIVDRIDPVEKKVQFALIEELPKAAPSRGKRPRKLRLV